MAWASDWLKRYDNEGIDGLKNRTKSGRRPELSEEIEYEIKTILMENNQGWTTKQIEELIIKKSGIKYHSLIFLNVSAANYKEFPRIFLLLSWFFYCYGQTGMFLSMFLNCACLHP